MSNSYRMIATQIRQLLVEGTYSPDTLIPSQHELSRRFGTSRVTIQRALNVLRLEGFLYTKKGVGTFVNSNFSNQDTKPEDYLRGLTNRQNNKQCVQSKVISFEIRQADPDEQVKLEIGAEAKIYDIIRLRIVNNEPMSLEYALMPVELIPGLTLEVLHRSIYQYVQNTLGLKVGSSCGRVKADIPDAYDREYLQCYNNEPVLEVDQVVRLASGEPFDYSQSRHRYDHGDFLFDDRFCD